MMTSSAQPGLLLLAALLLCARCAASAASSAAYAHGGGVYGSRQSVSPQPPWRSLEPSNPEDKQRQLQHLQQIPQEDEETSKLEEEQELDPGGQSLLSPDPDLRGQRFPGPSLDPGEQIFPGSDLYPGEHNFQDTDLDPEERSFPSPDLDTAEQNFPLQNLNAEEKTFPSAGLDSGDGNSITTDRDDEDQTLLSLERVRRSDLSRIPQDVPFTPEYLNGYSYLPHPQHPLDGHQYAYDARPATSSNSALAFHDHKEATLLRALLKMVPAKEKLDAIIWLKQLQQSVLSTSPDDYANGHQGKQHTQKEQQQQQQPQHQQQQQLLQQQRQNDHNFDNRRLEQLEERLQFSEPQGTKHSLSIWGPLDGGPLSTDPLNGDPLSADPLSGDLLSGDLLSADPLSGGPLRGSPLSKRVPTTKRWWAYPTRHRPRPKFDRRAPKSSYYSCIKSCVRAGKLHPIQCHTLC